MQSGLYVYWLINFKMYYAKKVENVKHSFYNVKSKCEDIKGHFTLTNVRQRMKCSLFFNKWLEKEPYLPLEGQPLDDNLI